MSVCRVVSVALLWTALQLQVVSANPAYPTNGQDRRSAVMRVYGPIDPPHAFWRFCEQYPGDCAKSRSVDGRFEPNLAQLQLLEDINLGVNQAIAPVTDAELYGISDYWTLPRNAKGDCEDYALLKRRLLIEAGWPASALLITVVRDEKFEGHAILTARTGKGDLMLDNKTDEIKLWHNTTYRFVMRQSYVDPRAWVALDPAQSQQPGHTAVAARGQ